MAIPYTFSIHAWWCSEALKLAQPVGSIVKHDGNRILRFSIIELRSWRHASFQKIPGWNKAILRFLHADGAARHDYQNPGLGHMALRHVAHH